MGAECERISGLGESSLTKELKFSEGRKRGRGAIVTDLRSDCVQCLLISPSNEVNVGSENACKGQ